MTKKILVINPGSTSTKLAIFEDSKEILEHTIRHTTEELEQYSSNIDQLNWREGLIIGEVRKVGFDLSEFSAIVARGGAGLDPVTGGTYRIDERMLEDLYQEKNAEHASNLAGIIAYNIAEQEGIPAFTVDPVSVDEFEPVARLSGLPELPRKCQSHALNLKAVARMAAKKLNKRIEDINLIGVHLGGGISVAPLKKGRIIDVNNANQGGPYSPERVGSLPVIDLVEYIFREKPEKGSLKRKLVGKGGLAAYLGTNDGQEIERMIEEGDSKAELVYNGMIYQIAKEIGAMAAVLAGQVEAIFITGGLAHSSYVVEKIKKRVEFIAPVMVFPGAEEMKHLAEGALRVLTGVEEAKEYEQGKVNTDVI